MMFVKHVNTMRSWSTVLLVGLVISSVNLTVAAEESVLSKTVSGQVLSNHKFTESDSILVVEEGLGDIKVWQASKALVPASLIKLTTAYLALDKWGANHAFHTNFYRQGNQLWVKGYGDPYLVSEELDLVVKALSNVDLIGVTELHIDDSYFADEPVPGRSKANDPYNAPLSSVAANFNTVMLKRQNNVIQSAEPQTPLTPIARKLATGLTKAIPNNGKAQRVNLQHRDNAQTHLAQLLLAKIGKTDWLISINDKVPDSADLVLRYKNTRTVTHIIRGMLEFSNNFMANQLFLSLGETEQSKSVSFKQAEDYAQRRLTDSFSWPEFCVVEGSGLSRDNQLSARQIDDLLVSLDDYKQLFKQTKHASAEIFAKTGTLNGVRTFAGYIGLKDKNYRFVFMFNRNVPWRYREQLLDTLVEQLIDRQSIVQSSKR